jgi:hypothetical protein
MSFKLQSLILNGYINPEYIEQNECLGVVTKTFLNIPVGSDISIDIKDDFLYISYLPPNSIPSASDFNEMYLDTSDRVWWDDHPNTIKLTF